MSRPLPPTLESAREMPPRPRGGAVHSAPTDMLDRPAGAYLASIPWDAAAPDPDVLDAAAFVSWL